MAKLTLIKKIVNKDVVNSSNLIMNVLFGGKVPEIYNENKVYNKGDVVLIEKDGVYQVVTITKDAVTGPFSPEFAEEVVFTELFKDSSVLTQNNTEIQTRQEALSDDLATLVQELAGLIDNRLNLKVLYRENFKDTEKLSIHSGLFTPGSIRSLPNIGIDIELKEPLPLATEPTTFKLKHFIEVVGLPRVHCEITFNALDAEPYWFNADDALFSGDFFEIPVDKMQKEKDVPYALKFIVHSDCRDEESVKISDLMVVFV